MTTENETHPFMYNMYGANRSTRINLVETVNCDNGDKLHVSFDYDTEDGYAHNIKVLLYSRLINKYIRVTELFNVEPLLSTLSEIIDKTIKEYQDENI